MAYKLSLLMLVGAACLSADFAVTPTTTATDLTSSILGSGVSLSGSPVLAGTNGQAGTFTSFTTGSYVNPITSAAGTINIPSGIILSTGFAADAANLFDGGASTDFGAPGQAQLSNLIGGEPTFDAASLSFNIVPTKATIYVQFLFASTEYPGSVGSKYNDIFGVLVNGTNVAVVPGTFTPISINTINVGDTFGSNPANPAYFTQNSEIGTTPFNYGGATVLLTATAHVNPGVENTLQFAIADASDHANDSAVLITAGSLSTQPPASVPEPSTCALFGSGLLAAALAHRGARRNRS